MSDTAECRNCGMELKGEPYHRARTLARHPETGESCRVNFYGGYVCSEYCDGEATRRQQASIDAHMTRVR